MKTKEDFAKALQEWSVENGIDLSTLDKAGKKEAIDSFLIENPEWMETAVTIGLVPASPAAPAAPGKREQNRLAKEAAEKAEREAKEREAAERSARNAAAMEIPAPAGKGKARHFASVFKSSCQPVMQRELASLVDDAARGAAPLQPVHLSGYAGLGKTHAVESLIFPALKAEDESWNLCALPPGFSLGELKKALVDHCHEKTLFFFDEIHAADKKALNLLKAVTETGGKPKKLTLSVGREPFEIVVNPYIHFFITASNESVRDSALVGASGRFLDCQFLPYTDTGKRDIFEYLLPVYGQGEIDIPDESRAIALRNVRPFARSIKAMIQAFRTAAKFGSDVSTPDGMRKTLAGCGYFPGGWRKTHIDVVRYCAGAAMGRQVQEIAMSPCRGADRKQVTCILDELTQGDLVITLPNGRKGATETGVNLLKKIDKKA